MAVVMNADLALIYKRMATDELSQKIVLAQLDAVQTSPAETPPDETLQDATRRMHDELDAALLERVVPERRAEAEQERHQQPAGDRVRLLLRRRVPELIRSKGETQNVEQKSGQGNVKS